MLRLPKTLLPFGAGALALGILMLAAPRAAHAIAATLVQVTNTPANPVNVLDAGNPANEPFEWEAVSTLQPYNYSTFTIPSTTADGRTVQRLVIEEVTAWCSTNAPLPGIRLFGLPAFSTAGASLMTSSPVERFFPFPTSVISSQQILSQETRIYVDPGVAVGVNLMSSSGGGTCAYSAFGHFVVQ
jgi:hypothetical protein